MNSLIGVLKSAKKQTKCQKAIKRGNVLSRTFVFWPENWPKDKKSQELLSYGQIVPKQKQKIGRKSNKSGAKKLIV